MFGNNGPKREQFAIGMNMYSLRHGHEVCDDPTEPDLEDRAIVVDYLRDRVFPPTDDRVFRGYYEDVLVW